MGPRRIAAAHELGDAFAASPAPRPRLPAVGPSSRQPPQPVLHRPLCWCTSRPRRASRPCAASAGPGSPRLQIIVAARNSSKRTTIVLENPAPRHIRGTPQFGEDTANHGSLFDTSAFKQLNESLPDSSTATFAYCRLGSEYQKYTTLWYTNEAAPILDQLDSPIYKCNHARHAKVAGGRLADGSWASAAAAAYPSQLNLRIAMAFTFARTGDPRPIDRQAVKE